MKNTTLALLLPLFVAGCATEGETGTADEVVGEADLAVNLENSMWPNALQPNALQPNALQPNALQPNALQPNALSPEALTAIQDAGLAGTLSRQLLKYIVSCALESTDTFDFSWVDGTGTTQNESYPGALGIAPDWTEGPLSAVEQRWVSACVAARTNYYGVTVIVSLRGDHATLGFGESERTSHPMQEGAFWGNLFAATPYVKSCNNTTQANIDNAREKKRDCAVGHWDGVTTTQCGPLAREGSCSAICTDRTDPAGDPDDGFLSCEGILEVITTFLPD